MKQKTRFKNFGNIGIGRYISPSKADISVSASKKPYRSISRIKLWNVVTPVCKKIDLQTIALHGEASKDLDHCF